jgi:hypothetical protein
VPNAWSKDLLMPGFDDFDDFATRLRRMSDDAVDVSGRLIVGNYGVGDRVRELALGARAC